MGVDFSKFDTPPDSGLSLLEMLEFQEGIMPPVKQPPPGGEDEDIGDLSDVARVVGPVDWRGFPLKYIYRRAFSEMELLDTMAGEEFKDGHCYLFLSRGDVDLISYLKVISRQQHIHHLGLATWNANLTDFELLAHLKRKGRIGSIDCYLGSINKYGTEARKNVYEYRKRMAEFKDVTVKVIKTHIKTFFGDGDKFPFVITGSPNLSTNVNSEAVCVIIDKGAYEFYRDFFHSERRLDTQDDDRPDYHNDAPPQAGAH